MFLQQQSECKNINAIAMYLLFLSSTAFASPAFDYDNDKDICGTDRLPRYEEQESKGYGDGVGGSLAKQAGDGKSNAKAQAIKRATEKAEEDARGRATCADQKTRSLEPGHHYTELKLTFEGSDNPTCETGTYQDDPDKWNHACRLDLGPNSCDVATQQHWSAWALCYATMVSCYSYVCRRK